MNYLLFVVWNPDSVFVANPEKWTRIIAKNAEKLEQNPRTPHSSASQRAMYDGLNSVILKAQVKPVGIFRRWL